MNVISMKFGFWASIIQSMVGYLYLVAYIVFLVMFPQEPWISIEEFASQYNGLYMVLLSIIQFLAFSQAFIFMIIAIVINYFVSEERKIPGNIGVCCSIIFLMLSSIHYYIQWTTVRIGLSSNMFEGLGQLAQFNFDSPVSVINILGWTFFFGISNIMISFCFDKSLRGKWLQKGYLVNGISCMLTFILFTVDVKEIMFLWTIILALTWYIYPLMAVSFRKGITSIS